MNILFICDEYPPGRHGGIGTMTRALARGLVAAGHQVLVAGLYPPGYGEKDYEEDQGVKVWRRRMGLDLGWIGNNYAFTDILLLKALRGSGLMRLDARSSARRFHAFVLELIGRYRIDIVEWPDYHEYFRDLPAKWVWPDLPVPMVIKFHGTDSYIRQRLKQGVNLSRYQLEKKHIERATALVAVSKDTAEGYRVFYRLNRNIDVLYNSIELRELTYSAVHAGQTIVYSGAMTRGKGLHSLMTAWNLLHEKCPDAILRVFGKGNTDPFAAMLSRSARQSVIFEGFVAQDRLYSAFTTASGAIFPSYSECFSIAPLEAMAAGCPVIYSGRSSGPELIQPGINGLLVDPDDAAGMAGAMILLLKDESLRANCSENGRRTVEERFTIQRSVADHIRLYEEQVARGKS